MTSPSKIKPTPVSREKKIKVAKLIKYGRKSTFTMQQMFSEAVRNGEIIVDFMGYKFSIKSLNNL